MTAVLLLALRASAGPLLAVGAAAALARASAALRHRVLVAGLVCAVVAMPAAWVMPSWALVDAEPAAVRGQLRQGAELRAVPGADPAGLTPGVGPGAARDVRGTADGGAARPALVDGATLAWTVWALGVAVAFGRLAGAWWRLRRITATGRRLTQGPWPVLVNEVAGACGYRRSVAVVASDVVSTPSTFGLRRPVVLVPLEAIAWEEPRIRIVLCHEIAHLARGDWPAQTAGDVLAALHWFNPIFHALRARLRREGEHACDDAVLAAGVPADDYAGHLIAIARLGLARPASAAVPMAHPSTLERRITAMLTTTLDRRPPSRRAVLAVTLALLAVTLPLAGLTIYAQGGPSTVAGTIYDPSGAVLPAVDVTLEDARQARLTATTDAHGTFEFSPLDAGDYTLTTSLPGLRPLRVEVTVAPGRSWNRAITMNVGTLQETITVVARRPATPRPLASSAGGPVRVGGNIKAPRKVKDVRPVYPEDLREAGLEGIVPLEALIGRDGTVESVRVVSADVHPAFLQAATDAVKEWRFTPTLLNGAPVEVSMNVSIRFSLSD